MEDLIKSQDEEHMRIHLKCLAKAKCAEDCYASTVILLGHAVSIIEEEIAKIRKETAEAVIEKLMVEKAERPKSDSKYQDYYFKGIEDGWNEIEEQQQKIKKQILKELL